MIESKQVIRIDLEAQYDPQILERFRSCTASCDAYIAMMLLFTVIRVDYTYVTDAKLRRSMQWRSEQRSRLDFVERPGLFALFSLH